MKQRKLMYLILLLTLFVCLPLTANAGWKVNSAGTYRYYDAAGKLSVNKWIGSYYVDKKGCRVINQWVTKNGKKYFIGQDGKVIPNFKGGFYQIDKKWYYYTASGTQKRGWLQIGKDKYYLSGSKGYRCHGWVTLKGKKHYFNTKTGKLECNKWVGAYYTDANGRRLINQWATKNGKKCFIGQNGKIISNFKGGFYQIDNQWYYYTKSGVQKKGWLKIGKDTYYLNGSTGYRRHGWASIKGKKYYFNTSSGKLEKNKWVGNYYVGSAGYLTKTLPDSYTINMSPLYQNPELPTGCESVALTAVLKYHKFSLSKTTIADDCLDYSVDNFVSAFCGDPYSYNGAGCFSPAITNAANRYLTAQNSPMRAKDISGSSLNSLYPYINQKKPVVLWASMYMRAPVYSGVTYYYNGKPYYWYYYEHCVVLCGYDKEKNTVLINDPLDGIVTRNASEFEAIYNTMGKMAVLID